MSVPDNLKYDLKYKSDTAIGVLRYLGTRWWVRKETRSQIREAQAELLQSRERIYRMAHELNSWRWGVGGAAYDMKGPQALTMVHMDLRNKIGEEPIKLTDDDFRRINT